MIGEAEIAAHEAGRLPHQQQPRHGGRPRGARRGLEATAICAARPSTCSRSSPRPTARRSVTPLQGLDNVILTPHIGGSTEEAQERIGAEVARKLIDYSRHRLDRRRGQLPAGAAAGPAHRHALHPRPPQRARHAGPPQRGLRAARPQHRGAVPPDRRRDRLRRARRRPGRTREPGHTLHEIRALDGTIRARLLYQRS